MDIRHNDVLLFELAVLLLLCDQFLKRNCRVQDSFGWKYILPKWPSSHLTSRSRQAWRISKTKVLLPLTLERTNYREPRANETSAGYTIRTNLIASLNRVPQVKPSHATMSRASVTRSNTELCLKQTEIQIPSIFSDTTYAMGSNSSMLCSGSEDLLGKQILALNKQGYKVLFRTFHDILHTRPRNIDVFRDNLSK